MVESLFSCPHCGSEYRRRQVTLSTVDDDYEVCAVCERVMDRWYGRHVPLFSLVSAAPAPHDQH